MPLLNPSGRQGIIELVLIRVFSFSRKLIETLDNQEAVIETHRID
jgi:hypothetical protein